jgi:toxin ParE1/3/4
MGSLRWTERAVENLAEIAEYISESSPTRANRVIAELTSAIALLTRHPELGKSTGAPLLRELIVAPYRVFYRLRGDTIEVVAIVHGRRALY